ncbi:MAG: Hpt domain-containing protein [Pirellulaceae bacterium]
MDGDESLLRQMAAITSADLPEVIEQTDRALTAGNSEQAGSGLHKLKGMLSTFETSGVTIEVHEMLELLKRGEVAEAKKCFDRHRSELDELVAEISSIAAK